MTLFHIMPTKWQAKWFGITLDSLSQSNTALKFKNRISLPLMLYGIRDARENKLCSAGHIKKKIKKNNYSLLFHTASIL